MNDAVDRRQLLAQMREQLGMVIPVWFAAATPLEEVCSYLRVTLADVEHFCRPSHVALVIDLCEQGPAAADRVAREVRERSGEAPVVDVAPMHQGKGLAVARGLDRLVSEPELQYFVARDCDGDHDMYDLPRLFRRLVEAQEREGTANVFAVGSRPRPHMALGWVRGEYELLLNRVLVEACNLHLAAHGTHVDLRYSLPETRYPDLQSGYKLYTRASARLNVGALRAAHDREPAAEVSRWGAEFVTVTELLLAGHLPVEVSRVSCDEQPQTTFDERDRVRAFGRQFVWLFRRLGTPSRLAQAVVDNALTQSPVRFAAGLWSELLRLREYVQTQAFPGSAWGLPPPHGEPL
jgi:GNAT superfamily N-acetyltransferase